MTDLPHPPLTWARKALALLQQRCPCCAEGRIYAPDRKMHPCCPMCGLLFEREPGYFMGSLYISYTLASVIMVIGLGVGHLLLPDWDLGGVALLVGVLFLPLASPVTRYARVLWIYFDRWLWPSRAGQPD